MSAPAEAADSDGDGADNLNLTQCNISGAPVGKKKKSRGKKKPSSTVASANVAFPFDETRQAVVRVESRATVGRSLITNTMVPAGTLFFNEKAVAVVSHGRRLCSRCGQQLEGDDSLGTVDRSFCSSTCFETFQSDSQLVHFWNTFDSHAFATAALHSCDKDLLRIVFALLALFIFPSSDNSEQSDTACEAVCTDKNGVIKATMVGVNALETHMDHQTEAWKQAVSGAINAMLDVLSQQGVYLSLSKQDSGSDDRDNALDKVRELALSLACAVNVNAYGILDYSPSSVSGGAALGFGLFPAVGLCVNHSCDPNSYYAYNGATGCMEYRTIRDVPRDAELTVSYVDVFQDSVARRDTLQGKRFFLCQCSRCVGYDLAVKTTIAVATYTGVVDDATGGKRSKANANKSECDALKASLSAFYQPDVTADADAWLNEVGASASTKGGKVAAVKGSKGKEGGNAATLAPVAGTSGGADGVTAADAQRRILADAALGGLHCEHCGKTLLLPPHFVCGL
jgi:hypothetical protein